MPAARESIRRRLLLFLVGVAVTLVIGAGMLTYWAAVRATNDAYDRSLLDPALELAANVRIEGNSARLDLPARAQEALIEAHRDLPMRAQGALMYDESDQVVFQVRGADDAIIAGVPELAPVRDLAPGQHVFLDGSYLDQPVRIVALHASNDLFVQVAETLHKRKLLIWEILIAELVPTLLIAFATILLAWIGVAHGLAPLARVRAELLDRSPQDLRPIADTSAPEEIAPVVEAFNRLLSQLRDASALQQRFLANAAHQLRTPIAGLQLHLELMLRQEHPADTRAELERLRQATVRAGHLTSQLLALAKAESTPDVSEQPKIVELHKIADTAARQWVPAALARGVDLGFSIERASVSGDELLLSEMLDNLIDNALRYTPAGGSVTVQCGLQGGRAFILVEDTGPGIPPSERTKVFERFYRVAGTQGQGSGLGLAIVNEVVERHDATISIDAGARGTGTRVTVTFPAPRPQPKPSAPPAQSTTGDVLGAVDVRR